MIPKHIDGQLLKKMILQGSKNLEINKDTVDSLNVFPVPDGDTGTNMFLTMNSAAKEVNKLTTESLESVSEAIANGSLMGARGNSGVILSQLFRGFAKGCKGKEKLDTIALAQALKSSSDTAYKAVMKPIEGTILTVAREVGDKALEISKKENDLTVFMESIIKYGEQVLNKTPEMLKVLKDAGVVDAGGKGLIFIFKGFLDAIKGKEVSIEEHKLAKTHEPVHEIDTGDIVFGYCTELIIKGDGIDIELLKKKLSGLGDSMLVVGKENLAKIHIHTNNPGKVLEHGLNWGELTDIKIDNMRQQHRSKLDYEKANNDNEVDKEFGIITVSMGDGLLNIFKDLSADEIITGGQTMNPSTEEIKRAIDKVSAKNIFILPNNSNIILAANQAKELSDKNIYVIPTKTIPQGIAALLAFNGELNSEKNVDLMTAAISEVKTGQVTYSVRDTQFNSNNIKKGDILGLYNGDIQTIGKNTEEVAYELLKNMITENDEIITIFYGEDTSEDTANKLAKRINEDFKDIDIEVYYGGQPLYYYIFSVE